MTALQHVKESEGLCRIHKSPEISLNSVCCEGQHAHVALHEQCDDALDRRTAQDTRGGGEGQQQSNTRVALS